MSSPSPMSIETQARIDGRDRRAQTCPELAHAHVQVAPAVFVTVRAHASQSASVGSSQHARMPLSARASKQVRDEAVVCHRVLPAQQNVGNADNCKIVSAPLLHVLHDSSHIDREQLMNETDGIIAGLEAHMPGRNESASSASLAARTLRTAYSRVVCLAAHANLPAAAERHCYTET